LKEVLFYKSSLKVMLLKFIAALHAVKVWDPHSANIFLLLLLRGGGGGDYNTWKLYLHCGIYTNFSQNLCWSYVV